MMFTAPACLAAENIIQSSEVSATPDPKIATILMVGTSALNTDLALGNKQALIAAEVRKLLKTAGIQVYPIAIGPQTTDAKAVVAAAVVKNSPSHVMTITIPRGEIYVKALTGTPTGGAKSYAVESEVIDAKTSARVWKYTAEVSATAIFGASNADVAESLVAKMRADGLL